MKKAIIKVLGLALLATTAFISCDEEGTNDPEVITNLKSGIMEGSLEQDYTLDAATTYDLSGSFIVEDGYTLTIPAGTQIVAEAGGTEVYIAVMMGGKIMINGTETNPVVMSSPNGNPSDWGGLTLCGKAVTSAGVDAEAEVGGFIYGGTDDTDNSGTIKYLVIKGTGAQINPESQYNGVSFYAVGSGTTVEGLAVINGDDDGVEFFGGTVSVSKIFLQNNTDDAIDWTEGWSGTVTDAYVEHTVDFSTVLEGDKVNNNPKINNLTAVSTVGGTALQFKKESGMTITGLSLTGYTKIIDMKDDGPIANVIIDGAEADTLKSYAAPATVDVSDWTWTSATIVNGTSGLIAEGKLSGVLESDATLDASVEYELTGAFIVAEGATLTIPAGTKIVADAGGTEVYIAVMMGGKININGTAAAPVVISSEDGEPADWGGLTICGKAVTTAGENAEAEVGGFIYGGTEATDNSGSVTYLVIIGTGAQINSESQYNGVSLYAVGSGTTLENIAVINGADDGVEFFGGSASVTNIYLENNEDDAVDWTEGWDGGIVNTYISHTIEGFSTAFEGDKANNNPVFTNVTAISTTGGTGLQFKKDSGGSITGLHMEGYDVDLDFKDEETANTKVSNITIDGATPDVTLVTGETERKYTLNSGKDADPVDISGWGWKDATL